MGEESSGNLYDVIGALYPLRSYQESFPSYLCSSVDESFRNFIFGTVLSFLEKYHHIFVALEKRSKGEENNS